MANASVTKSAPYLRTTSLQTKHHYTIGPCAATAYSKAAWSSVTGNVTGLVSTSSKTCATRPYGTAGSMGYSEDYLQIAIPINIKHGGHNFTVNISYALSVIASFNGSLYCAPTVNTPGLFTAKQCYAQVAAETTWGILLFDATNGSTLYGDYHHSNVQGPTTFTYISNTSSCNGKGSCHYSNQSSFCTSSFYYFNCVASGAMNTGNNSTWLNSGKNCIYSYGKGCYSWQNWTLNRSHSFWVEVWFDAIAGTYVSSGYPLGLWALGEVNGATLGNTGWKITSVTVK
ncbi:MAG TPA: hypothetical protein VFF67_06135 [Thermoplasmata archaeon]|nr:hypothetical protein [Thermoplasmata archaeon]